MYHFVSQDSSRQSGWHCLAMPRVDCCNFVRALGLRGELLYRGQILSRETFRILHSRFITVRVIVPHIVPLDSHKYSQMVINVVLGAKHPCHPGYTVALNIWVKI